MPVVITRGLLDGWPAHENWRLPSLLSRHHANLTLRVALGPKPGIHGLDQADGGGEAGSAPHGEGNEEELVKRWTAFEADIARRKADGWDYDEAAGVFTHLDGSKLSIEHPPKPAGAAKEIDSNEGGSTKAKASLGEAVTMNFAEFAAKTLLEPSRGRNVTHPEQRYITAINIPL